MSHITPAHARDSLVLSITKSAESDSTKIALCASLDLTTCRAENSQLKEKLTESEATIQRLKRLVTKIAEKQVVIVGELVELRRKCRAASVMQPETLDTSTSTVEDGMLEWDDYMPEWDLFQFSRAVSPLASSASAASELDLLEEDSELHPNPIPPWRRNEGEEEMEDEDEGGGWVGDDEDDDDDEPLSQISQISQQFMEANWDVDRDA
ncbi:uncharacterized protein [Drosophila kikkawai]|uniref:Uncharacterized protein n=1 Tax=Drosophila kikkawai TaxID=30033 RepID=A0A6P4J624_DROKI|nr:uncharacterized protein LOC108084591 [Drosophila kikkawai]